MAGGASSPSAGPTYGTQMEPPPPPPPPPPPARRSGLRTEPGLVIGVAALAVVLLLVGGILLGNPSASSSGTSTSSGVSYSSAKATGDRETSTYGTWDLVDTIGLDLASPTSLPLNVTGTPNCTTTEYVGAGLTQLAIPAFSGNLTTGLAGSWLLDYRSPASGDEFAVVVTAGVVTLAFELSGARCPAVTSNYTALPNDIVDSTTAVSAVVQAGAGAFLAAHPSGVSLVLALFPVSPPNFPSPFWSVEYSTCPVDLTGRMSNGSGTVFGGEVNATTGLLVPNSVSTAPCGVNVSSNQNLASSLELGLPQLTVGGGTGGTLASQGCASGDFCYNLPIELAAENITPDDFEARIMYPNQTVYPATGIAIVNITGAPVVYSVGGLETAWTDGTGSGSTVLNPLMSFELDMGKTDPTGLSLDFTLTGIGPYADSTEGWTL